MTTKRVSRLLNEIIVFVREDDWNPVYTEYLRMGGTKQIVVENVRDFRTPFGTYMIIATLSVTRVRAETWDLRDYVCRVLNRAGLKIDTANVYAPGRAEFYRV